MHMIPDILWNEIKQVIPEKMSKVETTARPKNGIKWDIVYHDNRYSMAQVAKLF